MKSKVRILTSGVVVTALCKNLDAYNLNHCDLLYTSFLKTYFATFLSILSNPLLRDTLTC